jgi:aminopeptidase N
MSKESKRTYLKDYHPPDFLVETIHLSFDIHELKTTVLSKANYRRNPAAEPTTTLTLNGADLVLKSIVLDGHLLEQNRLQHAEETLRITDVPESFTLEIETEIDPAHNTSLEGLYASGPMLCTQCEAEGFRRITYYPDRPDVMARFSTSITADKAKYPVLLSNGNLISETDVGAGRHKILWEDPFPKPCYLFALVAGRLAKIENEFVTSSGRKVLLQIYCEEGKQDQLNHALVSLKKSMRWDEERFGREYDLNRFMIVATPFFNSGAMENKGLNIFNDAYLLGRPETATDSDLFNIESVVAHEYFHNWSGDRVTCRDWFQLSLKEGFTVFRDQEFSADMHSPTTERISHVRTLRNHQFPEDAGPMAHPVRPDSYLTIDNFYTLTIYEKGAEVVRMLQTIFGREGFRKGTDLYFSRYDGQAVTCDDFVAALFEANPERMTAAEREAFTLWYVQAGTPRVKAKSNYDATSQKWILSLEQTVPATPSQPTKKPMAVPVKIALIDKNGKEVPLQLTGDTKIENEKVFLLARDKQDFIFNNVKERPIPSLLRDFSAPVILDTGATLEDLAFLAAHDTNGVNRWDALQQLALRELRGLIDKVANGGTPSVQPAFLDAMASVLAEAGKDAEFTALCLQLPGEAELGQMLLREGKKIDVDAIHQAREFLRGTMAKTFEKDFSRLYGTHLHIDPLATDGASMAARQLKNLCLIYLGMLDMEESDRIAYAQFGAAKNMTDTIAALATLSRRDTPLRVTALDAFYAKWQHNKLILDKWFALQAAADRPNVLQDVRNLMQHPSFVLTNPNMVYALVRSFTANLSHFHAKDGSGYAFLAEVVLKLDSLNPQIAGRIVPPLARFRDYDEGRAKKMQAEITRILAKPDLSKNVREVAETSLDKAKAA